MEHACRYLYALEREGYDDPYHTEYYLDEMTAKNRMISFAIQTKCVACVYVYLLDFNTPDKKMKLVKQIDLATDDTKRFYRIWLKQDAEEITTKYILDNPEIMHDCLTTFEFS